MTKANRQLAWTMFFTAVKSWQYHPGNSRYEKTKDFPLSTGQCAAVADEMLLELDKRFPVVEEI